MNRIFAFVAVVALLGFAIWAVLSPTPSASSTTTMPQSPAATPTQEEIPDLAPAPASTDLGAASEVERSTYLPASPAIDPNVTYAESAEEGILISVVDADSGEILPHAEVMVIDMGTVDTSTIEMEIMRQADFEGLFLHFGVVYPTNKQGQVRIPFPIGEMVLAGRTATHFDFVFNLELEDNAYELEIKRVSLLRVHVVDSNGQPVAGAPVGLRQRSGRFSNALVRNLTDEKGWANLRLFPMLIENVNPNESYVALLGLFAEPVEELVDLKSLPAEGVTLVMPEYGSLTVNLLDEQGQAITEYTAVSIELVDPNRTPTNFGPEPQSDIANTTATGKVVFPAVGFDLNIIAQARNVGGILSGNNAGHGPTASDPHVKIDLVMKMEAAVVKGRLVNEEGKPGPNLTLRSSLETERGSGSSSRGAQLRTDHEGYFRMKLEQPKLEKGTKRTLTLTFRATRKKPERNVVIDLSRDFLPGETDIGDAMLTVPPVAASGVVLKPDGAPLMGVQVHLERKQFWGDEPDDYHWMNLWESETETNDEGAFTVSGRFEAGSYRLQFNSDLYPVANQEIVLGSVGLEIRMSAGGALKGKLLLDEGLPHQAIELVLVHHSLLQLERNGPGEKSSIATINKDGSFLHNGLPLGTVDLILRCASTAEELTRIDGLTIDGRGEGVHDVGNIDLRGRLIGFTLKFVNAKNRTIKQVRVHSPDDNHSNWLWNENLDVVTTQASKHLIFSSEGYRSVELLDVREDATITMPDGIYVRVRITNPGVIPTGYRLNLVLRDVAERISSSHRVGGRVDEIDSNFEQVLTATKAGKFAVECSLAKESTMKTQGWWGLSSNAESMLIEVLDVPEEQLFIITLDENNIADILEKFQD